MDRQDLSTVLHKICDNVYFQPPESVKLKFPCIVYERTDIHINHADNLAYYMKDQYTLTVVDKNPDSTITEKVKMLPKCRFVRHFVSDNLNHDMFELYF